MPRGHDGIHRHLQVTIGAVLEADRHREPGGEFAVDLALGRAGADGGPGDEVGVILAERGVEELGADGQAGGVDVEQQPPGEAQALVDLEAAVEVRIVDQALPADGRAGFFKVDAHHHQQVAGEAVGHGLQMFRVIERRRRFMDGTGADDRQQPVVAAGEDFAHGAAGVLHQGGARCGQRQILLKDGRREQRAGRADAEIGGRLVHGRWFSEQTPAPNARRFSSRRPRVGR
jgi:hypothetical protein